MKETYEVKFNGVALRGHLSHSDADRVLAEAGWKIPEIPKGCNTVTFYFQTKEGLQALAVNQSGFAPTANDNENQVNGCMVVVCLDRGLDLIDARAILKKFIES
jgi:hypothetical protein